MTLDPVALYQIERERRMQRLQSEPPVIVPTPDTIIDVDRRDYFRRYYLANREKKLAASLARHQAIRERRSA